MQSRRNKGYFTLAQNPLANMTAMCDCLCRRSLKCRVRGEDFVSDIGISAEEPCYNRPGPKRADALKNLGRIKPP